MTSSPISNTRKWGTFAVGCLIAIVPNLDLTALHLAIPSLARDLGPSATEILWIADVYGFVLAGLLVTMGSLGDRIGHKRLMLTGMAAFAAASALTAHAPTAELLIAARALLGVAGATIMPSALALIRSAFTEPRQRTMAIGVFSGVGGLSVGLGPVLGGTVLDHFWWGAVFMINVPIMAVGFVVGLVLLPDVRAAVSGRLDLVSVPLSIAGVLGIVYAVKESAAGGLAQPGVGVAALIGVAGLTLFIRRQTRLSEPLIDVRLFRVAAFSGSVTTNLFAMFALVAQSLILAQYFQLVLGWSPLRSGLAGLPGALSAMVGGAALAPPLISALGRARVVALGLALSTAGFSLFVLAGTDTGYPVLLLAMIPNGLGMGMALTVTADTILASVPRDRTGAASAIAETAAELGGALGMAVLGSILMAAYRGGLVLPAGLPTGAGAAAEDSLAGALGVAASLPAGLAEQVAGAARNAFVDGMHVALVCSAALAAVVAVAALFTLRGVPKVIPEGIGDEPEHGDLVSVARQ
ncbi:MFS transporter [Actinomadura sp. HBU206391]|uniref:MFS transporter n=1 Tax=Actinomadura sp. HBU206391 TaxID=2731692 RepID=UPI00164FE1E6|nr:MFS transporter [Actinomadura sp. HBU206391]MBC6457209.1 MFS transporter [Actinomadura sp. HBU206391]